MTRKYWSIRLVDPAQCAAGVFGTQDVGEQGGLIRTSCVDKASVKWINPLGQEAQRCVKIGKAQQKGVFYPKNKQGHCIDKVQANWITQRWLVQKSDPTVFASPASAGHVGVQCADNQFACKHDCAKGAYVTLCAKDPQGARELQDLQRYGQIVHKGSGDFRFTS